MGAKPTKHVLGWRSRRATRLKSLAVLGTATLSMAAFGLAAAGPALADPATSYVVVGSDTTQNVMDAFAAGGVGNGVVGSWDAINPVTQAAGETITPVKVSSTGVTTNCSFTRPNGSGQGLTALRESINPTTSATPALGVQQGCVDFSRSSSGPSASGQQSTSGLLVYVPFALDGVAGATGGTTNIANADSFTVANLSTLYNCGTVTAGGVTYDPNSPVGAGNTPIDLYVPQPGSGTRNFWASTLTFNGTTLPACVHDHILAGPNVGQAVEEHDGTTYASDPNGYGPFSIAQWISQRNGHDDRRHGAVLHNLNGSSPFIGTPATGTLNTAYPITREVYNIAQYDQVVNTGDGNFDSVLSGLLAGTGSRLCSNSILIRQYGFATLSASTPDTCGSTANSLRAFPTGTI